MELSTVVSFVITTFALFVGIVIVSAIIGGALGLLVASRDKS